MKPDTKHKCPKCGILNPDDWCGGCGIVISEYNRLQSERGGKMKGPKCGKKLIKYVEKLERALDEIINTYTGDCHCADTARKARGEGR